jgi:quercetin dioxygenase-like cupin family protein
MNRFHNGTTHGPHGDAWRKPHVRLDARLERAAQEYARGALAAAELSSYLAHLDLCELCSSLVLEQRHVDETGAAVLAEVDLEPSADVWERIHEHVERSGARRRGAEPAALDGAAFEHGAFDDSTYENGAVRAVAEQGHNTVQTWKSWEAVESSGLGAPGLSLVAMGASAFEPTAIPGITTRRLAVDRPARRVSMLVRMEPGTRYPSHRHGGAEECYVIAGDLRVGDVNMRAGDFQRAEAGSVHPVQSTDGGCLLLITSSLDDELLES